MVHQKHRYGAMFIGFSLGHSFLLNPIFTQQKTHPVMRMGLYFLML